MIVEDEAWDAAGEDWPALAARLNGLVQARMIEPHPGGAALLLAGDERLAELNAAFRGKQGPTNVLSFPAHPETGALGDIAIAHGICAAEAEAQGKSFRDHAAHLILHGLLHLHGFDHEAGEEEAESMESLERAILAEIGVADPYRARRAAHA